MKKNQHKKKQEDESDNSETPLINVLKRENDPKLHQLLDKLFIKEEVMTPDETDEMWIMLHFVFMKEVQNIYSTGSSANSTLTEALSLSVDNSVSENSDKTPKAVVTENVPNDENIQNKSESFEYIHAIVHLIDSTVSSWEEVDKEKRVVPEAMAEIVYSIPKLLLLPDISSDDKDKLVLLIELWWMKKLTCKVSMCVLSLKFLLNRIQAAQSNVLKSDIQRVWKFRKTLLDMNLESNGCRELVQMLCCLPENNHYMKCKEGCNFITFLFTLRPFLVQKLHKSVKKVLPTLNQSRASSFGEIYCSAWLKSSPEMRAVIEVECVQNFMTHACVLKRQGLEMSKLGTLVFNILHQFHRQRAHPVLLKMLADKYEPIIWRFLKHSNNQLRCNAAQVFFDAYPLLRPGSGGMARSMFDEKQHQMVNELLEDNCPTVRVIAVGGVCNLLAKHWISLPDNWIYSWMNTLTVNLAVDSSCRLVRRQVFIGLRIIYDNVAARKSVQESVRKLKLQLHDTCEAVRKAFVSLLCKLRDEGENFWHYVALPHLLARLEVEAAAVGSLLVNLLFNSYCSATKTDYERIKRLMSLILMNPGASRNFFLHSKSVMSTSLAVDVLSSILKYLQTHVKNCVDPEKALENPGEVQRPRELRSKKRRNIEDKENVNTENVPEENGEKGVDVLQKMTLDNPRIMQGFIDIVVIIWTLHLKEKTESQKNVEKLQSLAQGCIQPFLLYYKDSEVYASLLQFAALIPANVINRTFHVTSMVFSQLKKLTNEDDEDKLISYINPLCVWNRGGDILELAQEWLHDAFTADDICAPRNRTKRNRIVFRATQDPKPEVALNFLEMIFQYHSNSKKVLTRDYDKVLALWFELDYVKELITERLVLNEPLANKHLNDTILQRCLLRYAKLIPLLRNDEFDPCEHYLALITWAKESLLIFVPDELPDSASDLPLTVTVLRDLVKIGSDTILLGNQDPAFCLRLGALAKSLTNTGCSLMFVHEVMSVASALCESVKANGGEDKYFKNFLSVVAPSLLVGTLKAVSSSSYDECIEHGVNLVKLRNVMSYVLRAIEQAYGAKSKLVICILEEFSDVFVNEQLHFMENFAPTSPVYKQLVVLLHDLRHHKCRSFQSHCDNSACDTDIFKSERSISWQSDATGVNMPRLSAVLISIFRANTTLGNSLVYVIRQRLSTVYNKDEHLKRGCALLLTALLSQPGKLSTENLRLALQSAEEPSAHSSFQQTPGSLVGQAAEKDTANQPVHTSFSNTDAQSSATVIVEKENANVQSADSVLQQTPGSVVGQADEKDTANQPIHTSFSNTDPQSSATVIVHAVEKQNTNKNV